MGIDASEGMLSGEKSFAGFCFDEACRYIIQKLENKEKIRFKKHYRTLSEMYRDLNV